MDILGGNGSWKAVFKHSQAQLPYGDMGQEVTYVLDAADDCVLPTVFHRTKALRPLLYPSPK